MFEDIKKVFKVKFDNHVKSEIVRKLGIMFGSIAPYSKIEIDEGQLTLSQISFVAFKNAMIEVDRQMLADPELFYKDLQYSSLTLEEYSLCGELIEIHNYEQVLKTSAYFNYLFSISEKEFLKGMEFDFNSKIAERCAESIRKNRKLNSFGYQDEKIETFAKEQLAEDLIKRAKKYNKKLELKDLLVQYYQITKTNLTDEESLEILGIKLNSYNDLCYNASNDVGDNDGKNYS